MNCVILQPSYVPWRGYFHQIRKADVFVFYDDVQYDKRGWRNRNRVKTAAGPIWLTIPVHARGAQVKHIPVCDIRIDHEQEWERRHWLTLQHCYARAPFFERYSSLLSSFYERGYEYLADLDIDLTCALARELGIQETTFVRSSWLQVSGRKTDRLLGILRAVGATHYITGPRAANYIEEEKFRDAGVTIEYMEYSYPEYPQLHPPYDPQVSILDLLFMMGPDAGRFIWGTETRGSVMADEAEVAAV